MHKTLLKRLFPLAMCSLMVSVMVDASISYAQIIAPAQPATPPSSSTQQQKSLPDKFNVNDHLRLPDQRTYVPAEGDTVAQENAVADFLVSAIDLLIKFIGSIALIVFILGALLTIVAEGKEDRLEKGKSAMLYALLGLAIAFFSFIIVSFVQSILF